MDGEPLLRHRFALDALEPHLEDIDELILLGDVFDFLFSPVEQAFAQAEPLFTLIKDKLQGKRVVFLAGIYDHHIVVRFLRAAVELKIATGASAEALSNLFCAEHHSFFQRFLDRRLEGIEWNDRLSVLLRGRCVAFAWALPRCPHAQLLRKPCAGAFGAGLAGGRHEAELMLEDYEALVVPLTELLFTVAQMPRGTATQQAFYAQFQRLGRLLQLPTAARRDAGLAVGRSVDNPAAIASRLRRGIRSSPRDWCRRRLGARSQRTA